MPRWVRETTAIEDALLLRFRGLVCQELRQLGLKPEVAEDQAKKAAYRAACELMTMPMCSMRGSDGCEEK
jgi:hypothetical protein